MKIRIFQKGFNYSQDGRGNRLVYHLQGCNLRCPWCSNPEGISIEPAIMVYKSKLLASACPYGAIGHETLDRAKCRACVGHECVKWGDFGVRFSSRDYEIDEIVDEALKSSPLFFDGGGVTLTGGEPTVQFEAVRELFTKLKGFKIHIALETNGMDPKLPELFSLTDQLIMDFKHYNSEVHKKFTGAGNETAKNNILAAKKAEKPLMVRIPLVNGFNAGEEDITGFAEFFKRVDWPGLSVELLKYHEFGKDKWEKCGMEYCMEDGHVSGEKFKAFEKGLSEAGVRLVRT